MSLPSDPPSLQKESSSGSPSVLPLPFGRFLGRGDAPPSLDRWDALVLLLGYGLLVIMYFGPYTFANHVLGDLEGDMRSDWIWKRGYLGLSLSEGRLPLMNPHMMANVPFLASNQSAIFYPLNWLFAVLPVVIVINLQIIAHFWAGLAAMHILARRLGCSIAAAVIAAMVFGFSGFAVLHWWEGHLPFVLEWPWTALAVLLWVTLQQRAQHATAGMWDLLGPALLLSLVLALQLFAGQPQITWFTLLILAILHTGWLLFALADKTKASRRGALRGTAWLFAGMVLTAPLVMVQVLPTIEFLKSTSRGDGLSLDALMENSLPPAHSAMLVAPLAFGGTSKLPYLDSPVQLRSLHEVGCFVGTATMILALAALLLGRGPGNALRWSLAVIALFGWWMALGSYGGLYEIMLKVLPGLSYFRCPGRFCFLISFAVALLAASGLDRLRAAAAGTPLEVRALRRTLLTLSLLLAGATVLYLVLFSNGATSTTWRSMLAEQTFRTPGRVLPELFYTTYFDRFSTSMSGAALVAAAVLALLALQLLPRPRPAIPLLVAALTAGEILHFASHYQTSFPVNPLLWPADIRAPLAEAGGRWRIGSHRAIGDVSQGMLVGVSHVWGSEPLMPRDYSNAMIVSQGLDELDFVPQVIFQKRSTPYTQALGMRWILLAPGSQVDGTGWRFVRESGTWLLMEDPHALPRGYTVGVARIVGPNEEIARLVNAADFEPTRTVLLVEPAPPGAPVAKPEVPLTAPPPGEVTIMTDSPEHFAARVDMGRPGWFVLMDQFFPGWSVTVNGVPAKIYQANATGRALPLGPGTHQIEMIYHAPGLRTGAWISATAWLLWGAGLLIVLLRNRKRTVIRPQYVSSDA